MQTISVAMCNKTGLLGGMEITISTELLAADEDEALDAGRRLYAISQALALGFAQAHEDERNG